MTTLTIDVEHHPLLANSNICSFLKRNGLSVLRDRCRTQMLVHEWIFEQYFNVHAAYRMHMEMGILEALERIRCLGVGDALSYIAETAEIETVSYTQGQFIVEYL